MSRLFFVFPQKYYVDFQDFPKRFSTFPIAAVFRHKTPGSIALPGDRMLEKKN